MARRKPPADSPPAADQPASPPTDSKPLTEYGMLLRDYLRLVDQFGESSRQACDFLDGKDSAFLATAQTAVFANNLFKADRETMLSERAQAALEGKITERPGRTWAFHPSGLKVELPVSEHADYGKLLAAVDRMLAAGWLAAPAGAEPGEDVQEIGAFTWRKVDSRQSQNGWVPRVDLYSTNAAMKFPVSMVYLNTPEDEEIFERLAGLKIESTPEYIGQGKLERGNRQTDRLITPCRHFKVVIAENPEYDPQKAEAAKAGGAPYTVAKRKFVRFLDAPAAGKPAGGTQQAASPPAQPATSSPQLMAEEFTKFLYTVKPGIDEFNMRCRRLNDIPVGPHRDRAIAAMKEYGEDKGWTWAPERKCWVSPPLPDDGEIPF